MQFDPSLSAREWLDLLRQEAERAWGPQRVQALAEMLERTAAALAGVANCPVTSEEELFTLGAEPFPHREA